MARAADTRVHEAMFVPPPLTLAIDAHAIPAWLALLDGDRLLAQDTLPTLRDATATLPARAANLLGAVRPARVAITLGPGSFTGLRAALAFAHGLALAAAIPLIGATVGEALAAGLPQDRPIWIAHPASHGRIYLERDGTIVAHRLDALPTPPHPITLAGSAAEAATTHLPTHLIHLSPLRYPTPQGLAHAATLRQQGHLPPRPPLPLYIDAALTT